MKRAFVIGPFNFFYGNWPILFGQNKIEQATVNFKIKNIGNLCQRNTFSESCYFGKF